MWGTKRNNTVICHISTVHPAYDDRIFYKQCIGLVEEDFEVHLVAHTHKDECRRGVNIHAVPSYSSRIKRIVFGGSKAFFLAVKIKADVYQLHDPELIIWGFVLKILGKKVIFDFHELVKFQIESKNYFKSSFLKKIVLQFYLVLEKVAVKRFDAFLLAEDGYVQYFEKNYQKYFSKIFVVRNYPMVDFIQRFDKPVKKNHTSIIYVGGLSEHRGIKETIRALEILNMPIKFIILGKWETKAYYEECERLKGWKFVDYRGFKLLDDLYSDISESDIGISLLYPIKNYTISLPVKIFEYMALGKPVLMSDFPLWERTFNDIGYFADPLDPFAIAKKLKVILNQPDVALKKGKKGRDMILKRYNWSNEMKEYLAAINYAI